MRRLTLTVLTSLALILSFFVSAQLQENIPEKIARKQPGHQRQSEGRPASDVVARWQEFAERNKKPIAVTWNPKRARPKVFSESFRCQAVAFRQRLRGVL